MAFLEGFIQQFMGYLAELARSQGSSELQYTDVHGVCDIAHTERLFRALALEMEAAPPSADADPFEGVSLLELLVFRIMQGSSAHERMA